MDLALNNLQGWYAIKPEQPIALSPGAVEYTECTSAEG